MKKRNIHLLADILIIGCIAIIFTVVVMITNTFIGMVAATYANKHGMNHLFVMIYQSLVTIYFSVYMGSICGKLVVYVKEKLNV
ncbi:MAG: hypothetical protein [Caudoviricetes sp.]|nr:MAG: hypothetical protein [Caudoviricetes sp.]